MEGNFLIGNNSQTRNRSNVIQSANIGADVEYSETDPLNGKQRRNDNTHTCLKVIAIIATLLSIAAIIIAGFALGKDCSSDPIEWEDMMGDLVKKVPLHVITLPPASKELKLNINRIQVDIPLGNSGNNYSNKNYILISTVAGEHKVVISSGGASFDKAGLYKTLMFEEMENCFVAFSIIDNDRVVITSWNGVKVCNDNCTICEHPSRSIKAPWANVGALEVEMATFISKNNIESGEITPTHNNHNLNSNSNPIAMTLPEDLTPYIGKTMKICSISGFNDTIVLEGGNKFDSNGYWGAIRFDGNGKSPCCVDFFVASANKIDWGHMNCASFCQDDSFLHCIDPERPYETNKFHGSWFMRTRSFYCNREAIAGYTFDMRTVPLTHTVYMGDGDRPREPVAWVEQPYANPRGAVPLYYFFHDNQLIHGGSVVLTVQPQDSNRLIVMRTTPHLLINSPKEMIKVDTLKPIVVPYETGTLDGTPPSDAIKTLHEVQRMIIRGVDPSLSSLFDQPDYIGYEAQEALMNEIISTGKVYTNLIHKIFVTRNSDYNLTRIDTSEYHHVSYTSAVTITDCTGDWAAFNGVHNVQKKTGGESVISDPNLRDYGPDPDQRSVQHSVWVSFDSSSLPSDMDNILGTNTGACRITVSYGPISPNSEIGDIQRAQAHWFDVTFKGGRTHAAFYYYVDNPGAIFAPLLPPAIETFAELESKIQTKGAIRNQGVSSRRSTSVSSMYSRFMIRGRFIGALDPNNRFGIDPHKEPLDVFNLYGWHTTKNNYIVDKKTLYYKCDGPTSTFYQYLMGRYYLGDNANGYNCGQLKGVMVNYDELPPDETHHYFTNELLNGASIRGNSYANLSEQERDDQKKQTFAGRVNPLYTNGENIGYIRLENTGQSTIFYNSLFGYFNSPAPGGKRELGETDAQIWSALMEYLVTDLDCKSIIIDIRGNGGGLRLNRLASFFGNSDYRYASSPTLKTGSGYDTRIVNYTTLVFPSPSIDSEYPLIFSSSHIDEQYTVYGIESTTIYPNSKFTDGDVIILTDSGAASGGDIFPNLFLGENMDKDLGANTKVKIIGDIDGRISGISGEFAVQTSGKDNRLMLDGDIPFSLVLVNSENSNHKVRKDGTSFTKVHPGLYPDCAPTLTGLAGGCPLPNDLETLLYPDYGFVTNTRPRLTGDTRPQTASAPIATSVTLSNNTLLPSFVTIYAVSDKPHGFTSGQLMEINYHEEINLITSSDLLRTSIATTATAFESTGSTLLYTTNARRVATPTNPNIYLNIEIDPVAFSITSTTGVAHGVPLGQIVAGPTESNHVVLPKIIAEIPKNVINSVHNITVLSSYWMKFTVPVTYTDISAPFLSKITDRSEWRDTWMEESIRAALAGLSSKKSIPRRRKITLHNTIKRKVFTLTDEIQQCEEGDVLKHIKDVPKKIQVGEDEFGINTRKIIDTELKTGGLCLSNGELMVSPKCTGLPALNKKKHADYVIDGEHSMPDGDFPIVSAAERAEIRAINK
ncbi:hypothetical protein KA005_61210 [bacterium]|nr:hypothetical protein [bacterium]